MSKRMSNSLSLIDSAHGGEGWIERGTLHIQELGNIWACCGVTKESSNLRHVLLRRPGKEIENKTSASDLLWTDILDPVKAREQHDNLANIYREHGVIVDYIEGEYERFPNLMFVRDLFTMTPQGAILSRMASDIRKGEEQLVAKKLIDLKIPIIATPFNDMLLEGPDIVIINEDLVFLGMGIRTNLRALDYIEIILKEMGFTEIVKIQTTYGCGHLDGVFNILTPKTAVLVPKRASYLLYSYLKRHGFDIIELSNTHEVDKYMAINFVSIDQETILINKGSTDCLKIYQNHNVRCIEVDVSELMKGGGAVHCLTGVIHRN